MTSKLTRAEVLRIAALARLELDDAEVDLFAGQLAEILGFASEIQRIDTNGVAPFAHAPAAELASRPDEPAPSLDRNDILRQAPGAAPAAGLFKVPKVL